MRFPSPRLGASRMGKITLTSTMPIPVLDADRCSLPGMTGPVLVARRARGRSVAS